MLRLRFYSFALAFAMLAAVVHASLVVSTSQGTFGTAQILNGSFSLNALADVQDSTTIPHVEVGQLGRPGSGFDFYRFTHVGGTVHLDIDSPTSFDSEIGFWDASGNLIANNDDNGFDAGDTSALNSAVFGLNLASGDYIVGVGGFNSAYQSGAPFITGAQVPNAGIYTLNISANSFASAASEVPEPTTLAIFGSMIVLLGGIGWWRVRTSR